MLNDALNFGELEDGAALGLPPFTTVIGDIRNLQTHPRQDRGDSRVPGVTTLTERAAIAVRTVDLAQGRVCAHSGLGSAEVRPGDEEQWSGPRATSTNAGA